MEQLHIDAWQIGIKAIAIYRDNCKVAQPLAMAKKDAVEDPAAPEPAATKVVDRSGRADRREGRQGAGPGEAPPRRARAAPSSSGWPTARASSPSASTTTAVPARCSSRSRSRARPSPGSWTPSPSRSPRPAVRRAAAHLRRGVHQHPLRAGRHDRRPRDPDRHVAARLHLPPAGGRLPVLRGAGRARHPHHQGAHAAHAARRRGDA